MSISEPAEIRVIGVLVAYDVARDPMRGMDILLSALDHVIVVDNAHGGHPALLGNTERQRMTIIVNNNNGGLAGAYNAAIDHINSALLNATHVLFVDDDTDTLTVAAFLAADDTRSAALRTDVSAVAPAYIDRETGLRGAHICLKKFSYEFLPRHVTEPTAVSFLINSMSLWSLSSIRHIGRYSTRLQVDHVDTDYCLRAATLGYNLILNPKVTFLHSIGKRQKYQFFGRTLQSGGHGPARRKMIACNTVLLGKYYFFRFPAFGVLCVARLLYEALGILMVEDNRRKKLGALGKGVLIGMLGRYV